MPNRRRFNELATHALRADPLARQEADTIQQRHGSRRSGLRPTTRRPRKTPAAPTVSPAQGSLFD